MAIGLENAMNKYARFPYPHHGDSAYVNAREASNTADFSDEHDAQFWSAIDTGEITDGGPSTQPAHSKRHKVAQRHGPFGPEKGAPCDGRGGQHRAPRAR